MLSASAVSAMQSWMAACRSCSFWLPSSPSSQDWQRTKACWKTSARFPLRLAKARHLADRSYTAHSTSHRRMRRCLACMKLSGLEASSCGSFLLLPAFTGLKEMSPPRFQSSYCNACASCLHAQCLDRCCRINDVKGSQKLFRQCLSSTLLCVPCSQRARQTCHEQAKLADFFQDHRQSSVEEVGLLPGRCQAQSLSCPSCAWLGLPAGL